MREKARAEGAPLRYDGRWRDRDPSEAPPGVKPVIRLQAPTEGETVVEDEVQGRVVWPNKDLDDLVLLRSDGTPTYMLAVVVDDHDMGVTQIIRGDDHLTNAARQTQIYQALGWDVPSMAHIPLIHGPDGAKLSKRHGALGVDAYRGAGLPAGGAAQLPRAPRLEPRRPGDLLDRGDDRRPSISRRSAARRRASTSPSSRTSTASTCAPTPDEELRRRRSRASCRRSARSAALGATLDAGPAGQAPRRHAGPEGARQDADRAARQRLLPLRAAPAGARREGGALLADDGRARRSPEIAGSSRRCPTGAPPRPRPRCAPSPRAKGCKLGQVAQPLRAALTGRATSPGAVRRDGGARPRGKPGAPRDADQGCSADAERRPAARAADLRVAGAIARFGCELAWRRARCRPAAVAAQLGRPLTCRPRAPAA